MLICGIQEGSLLVRFVSIYTLVMSLSFYSINKAWKFLDGCDIDSGSPTSIIAFRLCVYRFICSVISF